MIIIYLMGGLGNQLFQYAFARSLSYNLDTELFLDVSYFNHQEPRKHVVFGLNSFNISGIIGYYPYVEKTSVGINYEKEQKLTRYVEGDFPKYVGEYGIVKNIKNIKLPAFFRGYYQFQIKNNQECLITENYFKENIDLIHSELKYIKSISINSQNLINEIENYESVALHIRHGDYEDIPNFGLCSREYYQNAIDMLSDELDNPKFYIFTEDPYWASENLNFDVPYKIIEFNESKNAAGRAYGELLNLMSSCKHFIIANSTFSWWAAFLSEYKYKIIISPKPWFQSRMILGCDTIDNVKTINLKNDYSSIYESSNIMLYDSDIDNSFNFDGSEFFIRNITPKNPNSEAIIKFSLKSNCFNGLRIYYKTKDESEFLEKNSLNLYYYKDETINHSLILPKTAVLDEILIRPYTLEREVSEYIELNSIKVKEILSLK